LSVLECRDLRKTFGDLVVVNGVGFDVAEDETYGLSGPQRRVFLKGRRLQASTFVG